MVVPLVDIGIQQRAAHFSVYNFWGPKLMLGSVIVVASLSALKSSVCIIHIKRLCVGLAKLTVIAETLHWFLLYFLTREL